MGADESDFHDVSALPGDHGALFVVHRKQAGIDTLATFGKNGKKILIQFAGQNVGSPRYSPTGHIVFERWPANPGIWAAPFSLSELKVTGAPFLAVAGGAAPSVSWEGALSYAVQGRTGTSQLFWVDRTGKKLGAVGPPVRQGQFPRLSPDQRKVITYLEEGGS